MPELSVDITGIPKWSKFLEAFPKQTSVALLRGLKRGTDTAHTAANRIIASDIGIKVGDVRKRIRKVDPNGRTLTGELHASKKRIPVIDMGARGPEPSRGRGSGVRWRGGSSAHAFIARMPNGHRGVFQRTPGVGRKPIHELFGPSIGRVMDRHRREIVARGTVAFHDEFDRLLNRMVRFGGSDVA